MKTFLFVLAVAGALFYRATEHGNTLRREVIVTIADFEDATSDVTQAPEAFKRDLDRERMRRFFGGK